MSTQVATPDSRPFPAPADPQRQPGEAQKTRQERRKAYPSLREFLLGTCKAVESEDEEAWRKIRAQQNKCQAYYDDRVYGKINDKTGEWEDFPEDDAEFRPQDNKYKEQVDKLQMEMARSYVQLNVEPTDETDSRKAEGAKFIQARLDANRKRLFTQHPEFVLSENYALLIKTLTFRYTYFDREAKDGPRETRPKFETMEMGENASVTVCGVCHMPRKPHALEMSDGTMMAADSTAGPGAVMDALTPCPGCGSRSTKTLSTSPVSVEMPVGEEEVPAGLVRSVHADPAMVKLSLNARNMQVSSSPYLVWTQMVEHGKLEQMFRDAVIPAGDDDSNDEAQFRRDNETAVSNSSDWSATSEAVKGGEQLKKRKFQLIWLDPWMYADYVDEGREQNAGGFKLPPGQTLGASFPKGLCIAKVGNTLLALWNEDKNKKWSACVYGLREHAFHGSGTNALVPMLKTHLDVLSYRIANIYYNTFRREFLRQGAISGDQLPKINEVGIITNVDEGTNLVGNAYGQAPPTPLPAEVPMFTQELKGSIQEQAGTSSLSLAGTSAESDALGTATGIAAMRDQAVGRMGPNLMLKAAMEVETAFQILEAEQANYSPQALMALAGLRPDKPSGQLGYTVEGVECFLESDLRADFLITPAPGSWMPVTEQEKKADAMAFADATQKVQNPEVVANLAKVFKQPLSEGGWGATEREAARRIEEFAEVAAILVGQGLDADTPQAGQYILDNATDAQMSPEMDNHPVFEQFYKDWWVSDEARTAPKCLKAAVRLRTLEHKNGQVGVAQDANAREVAAQIPNKLGEIASRQMDAQQAQAEAMQQADLEGAQKDHEAALAQQQGQAELAQQAASHALEQDDREHALGAKVAEQVVKGGVPA
jgi:hypothetical protein